MAKSPGFESLIVRYQLTLEDVDKQITDIHIEAISRTLCGKWRSLPAHLELDSIIIEDIDHLQVEEDQKRNKFFTTWKAKKGLEATYRKLISALQKIEYNDDAQRVCELLSQSVRMQLQQQQQPSEPEEKQQQQPSTQPDTAGM